MSFVKLPSGDWVDLKLVQIIRTEALDPGGPRCTVMTEKGDLPIRFNTFQEASDWMVGFGEEVARFKGKVPRSPEPIAHTQNYTSFRYEGQDDVACVIFRIEDGSEVRYVKGDLQGMKSALCNLAFRPDHSGSDLRRYIVITEALSSWPCGE